jgi:hypothetical protein
MSDESGIRRVYEAPRAVLVGGFGVAGMIDSGLFTGNDNDIHGGTDSWEQTAEDTRARCVPGFGAASGCNPGTGVTTVSL